MAHPVVEVHARATSTPVISNPLARVASSVGPVTASVSPRARSTRPILLLVLFLLTVAVFSTPAQTVYMQDTPSDTGVEPNPDTGPMWVSQDIWVRNAPDPGYQPYPFTEGSPPWALPPHQDPVYRDPLKSTPNYVYVQVRNHGTSASTGTERLRLYWAKASTGLSWPTQWVDYQPGGPLTLLYGAEITKPRKNGATASAAEQTAYVNAILAVGTKPAYVFPMGIDFWHTQQEVHDNMGSFSNIHETLAFLPWHREFVNRYELLLQEYDPTVKLLYWDWATNPSASLSFMGSFSGSIGAPFNPALAPPTVTRGLFGSPPAESDSAVLARSPYDPFISYACVPPVSAPFMSALEDCSHNYSHGYIGGNMSSPATSAQDPFFFMLHGNVDRLWAQWQRNSSDLPRLDPTQTYGASLGSDTNLSLTMAPWDGSPGLPTSASSFQIQPWETTTPAPSGGNYVVAKLPTDPSVVSPPIYDIAPLTIPVLQPGQAVVIQIPWYPPNPADFASFGPDQSHFCLLARIETSTTAPFGMDYPETSDVYTNTKNNNKIVWKNVTVDVMPGPMMMKSVLLRNIFNEPVQLGLNFAETQAAEGSFLKQGRIFVDLQPQLFERWRQSGSAGRGIKAAGEGKAGRIEILSPEASIRNIKINPDETFSLNAEFVLSRDYSPRPGSHAQIDLIQVGAPGNPEKIVGGQRFTMDFSKLVLIKPGDEWRYWDNGMNPGNEWRSLDYNDSKWKLGAAPLGAGDNLSTTLDAGPTNNRYITTYFRHTFEVAEPSFYRSAVLRLMRADGAIVYVNGKEVYRVNLPAGTVTMDTLATRKLTGLERDAFFPVKIDPANLRHGKNIIAAEIHLNSPQCDGIRFDLELLANDAGTGFPPDVAFAGPPDGAMFQAGESIPIQLEALSGDGKIESVSLYVDGKVVGTEDEPPYSFLWPAVSKGAHRLRAVAIDNRHLQSTSFHTVTVVERVLPRVALVEPRSSTAVTEGRTISVSAEASDRDGKIARVEFWVKDMATFTTPSIRVATVTSPPYRASIRDLKPGHYMVWAIAVNDRGGTTQSFPAHIMINAINAPK
jgi:tyrosinase-like protein/Big-like domain-containing protein